MLTWKYCVGSLLVYFGHLILDFLAHGDSGEGGSVVGFWMMGDGVICAVFGELSSMMMVDAMTCSFCIAGGGVSLSAIVSCWRAGGGGLVIGSGSCLAAVGWQDHSPAEGAGCLLLLPSSCTLVASCERSI